VITVHHLENSRSQRVLWLLEELALPYEIVRYARHPKTMLAPPELRRIHPLGKAPVITDGDKTLAESGAILEYLVDAYGQGRLIPPPGTPARLRYTMWMHYAEGSAMPPLVMKLVFSRLPGRTPKLLRPLVRRVMAAAQSGFVDPQIKAHADYWEAELSHHPWFASEGFTAADIQMSFPLEAAATRGRGTEGRPKVQAFLERIHARPAYLRALERGGPYALMR
jgi:glutathione S-transferase